MQSWRKFGFVKIEKEEFGFGRNNFSIILTAKIVS